MSTYSIFDEIPADFMFAHACAISSGVLSEEQHRKCSQHPYELVRERWAERQDLTEGLVLAALGVEQDVKIRAILLSKPVISGTDAMWRAYGGDWDSQVAVAMRNDVDEAVALQVLNDLPKDQYWVLHTAYLLKACRGEGFTNVAVGEKVAEILVAYDPERYEGAQKKIIMGDCSPSVAGWYWEDVDSTNVNGAVVNPYAPWFCIPAHQVVTWPLYSLALQPLVSTYPNNLSQQIAILAQGSSKFFFEVVNAVAKIYDDAALREHVHRSRGLSVAELEVGVRYYESMSFGFNI